MGNFAGPPTGPTYTGDAIKLLMDAAAPGASPSYVEVPITKLTRRGTVKKTEVTGSTSLYNSRIWQEFSPGAMGGGIDIENKWRVGQQIGPPVLVQGQTYGFYFYVIRPGWRSVNDPGLGFTGYVFIDEDSNEFDPSEGAFTWSVKCTYNGGITWFGS